MKKILFMFLYSASAFGQALTYTPRAVLATLTTDGINATPWTSAAMTGAISYTPEAVLLYCQASPPSGPITPCAPGSGGGGSGTVTSFAAPSASWPTWLVPAVTNATTTPSLAVTASAIPNSALANASTTVNGQTCTLGGTCTINTGVTSFNTRSGAVVPATGDYSFSLISGTAATTQIGTGTPASGQYVDGGTGAWTNLPAAGSPTNYVITSGPSTDQSLTAAYTAGGTTMTVGSTTGYFVPTSSIPLGYIAVGYAVGAFNACSYTGLTSTQFTGLTCGLFNIASTNQSIGNTVQEIKAFSANTTSGAADVIALWNGNTLHSCSTAFNGYSYQSYSAGTSDVFCNSGGKGTVLTGPLTFASGAASIPMQMNAGSTGLTTPGNFTIQGSGAASAPGASITGVWASGSATTSYPQLYVAALGATQPTNFQTGSTGIGIDAASGFAGHFVEGWLNGTSEFNVAYTGLATFNGVNSGGSVSIIGTTPVFKINGDTGLSRDSTLGAGYFDVGNGSSNDKSGTLTAKSLVATSFVTTPTTVAYSATPAFVATNGLQTITLTGAVTSSTLSGIASGQTLIIQVCENATGGYAFVFPTTMHGAGTIATTASTCSQQSFASFNGTDMVATAPMITGVAP